MGDLAIRAGTCSVIAFAHFMSPIIALLFVVVFGYFVGSISFAVLVARKYRVDIFSVGSGNPGATNIMRTLGRGPGITCFLLDALKGAVAAVAGFMLARYGEVAVAPLEAGAVVTGDMLAVTGLIAAILGHSYSVFLRFRGGKGVATTVGGLFVVLPLVMGVGVLVWGMIFLTTRYVSLASLLLGFSLPITSLMLGQPLWQTLFCLGLALIVGVRHRSNLQRLLQGREARFGNRG